MTEQFLIPDDLVEAQMYFTRLSPEDQTKLVAKFNHDYMATLAAIGDERSRLKVEWAHARSQTIYDRVYERNSHPTSVNWKALGIAAGAIVTIGGCCGISAALSEPVVETTKTFLDPSVAPILFFLMAGGAGAYLALSNAIRSSKNLSSERNPNIPPQEDRS